MPRLGELLIAAGVLTAEQVEQALRAQVMWGGRLGTNLIELHYLELDALSKALGRQHNVPAALARHFEKADPALQRMLSPDFAERFSCVPLMRMGEGHIAIASISPLAPRQLAIVADELAVDVAQLVPAIAAELRIRYQLERVYGIRRAARFLRARGKSIPPFPQFQTLPTPEVEAADPPEALDAPGEAQIEAPYLPVSTRELAAYRPDAVAEPREDDVTQERPIVEARAPRRRADTVDDAPAPSRRADTVDDAPAPSRRAETVDDAWTDDDESERDARAETARDRASTDPSGAGAVIDNPPFASAASPGEADVDAPLIPAHGDDVPVEVALDDALAIPLAPSEDEASARERRTYVRTLADAPSVDPNHAGTLGRIAIRKVAVGSAPRTMAGATLGEATRAIRRGTGRDRVAELVIDTLERFAPACDAAILLVVRGATAISWKGFQRAGGGLGELAVPLDGGLVPQVVERNLTLRKPCGALDDIDRLLLGALGASTGELVVVPIAIADQVMCVIAIATTEGAAVTGAEAVAAAAGAAFARLMRDASR